MKLHTDVPRYTRTEMLVFCMHVQYYFRRLLLATSVRIFGKIRTNEIVYKVGSWLTKTIIDKVEGYVRFDKRCFASLTSDPASDLCVPLIEMPIRCKRERIKQTIAMIFWIAVQTTNYTTTENLSVFAENVAKNLLDMFEIEFFGLFGLRVSPEHTKTSSSYSHGPL